MATFPAVAPGTIGWLTTDQMVEVDRIMIEELHIELVQMMENAGRHLARLVLELAAPASVVVFAGSGGNGGGGLVAARHLLNAGVDVQVAVTRSSQDMAPVPGHQLDIVERMGAEVAVATPAAHAFTDRADVAIDAVIGYTLLGPPRGRSLEYINDINTLGRGGAAVVSLDVPSGLDTTTGTAPGGVVTADATLTLAAPKIGLLDVAEVGALYVADISVPPAVLQGLGATPVRFGSGGIIRLSG